jgi:hypothetical protein
MDKNTEKSIKLVAEYMGYTATDKQFGEMVYTHPDQQGVTWLSQFKYNENWGKLMDAWFKFQKEYNSFGRTNQIPDTRFWVEFRSGILNEDVNQSFQALVEGIEWLNKYTTNHE